ncbi:MAG: hypothetical protein WCH04_10620 [Gammaproteobacteria bacterium]
MNILSQIALLAGLIAGISLIWLAVRAFGKHVAWGLVVLFLSPLAAVIFGIRYWRDEKGPFLVYVATFSIAMTLGLYVFTLQGGWNTVRTALRNQQYVDLQISSGNGKMSFVHTSLNSVAEKPVRNDKAAAQPEQAKPVPHNTAGLTTNAGRQVAPEKGTPAVTSAKPTAEKKRYRAGYVAIPPSLADDYIGMTVKVKRMNRPEQDCVLRSVTPAGLGFEQHVRGGGTFSFKYRQSDIEKLRVLVKQAY